MVIYCFKGDAPSPFFCCWLLNTILNNLSRWVENWLSIRIRTTDKRLNPSQVYHVCCSRVLAGWCSFCLPFLSCQSNVRKRFSNILESGSVLVWTTFIHRLSVHRMVRISWRRIQPPSMAHAAQEQEGLCVVESGCDGKGRTCPGEWGRANIRWMNA